MSVRVLMRTARRVDVYAEPDETFRPGVRPSIGDRMRFASADGKVWQGVVDLVEPFGTEGWHVRLRRTDG